MLCIEWRQNGFLIYLIDALNYTHYDLYVMDLVMDKLERRCINLMGSLCIQYTCEQLASFKKLLAKIYGMHGSLVHTSVKIKSSYTVSYKLMQVHVCNCISCYKCDIK